jgi:hypothetical protein
MVVAARREVQRAATDLRERRAEIVRLQRDRQRAEAAVAVARDMEAPLLALRDQADQEAGQAFLEGRQADLDGLAQQIAAAERKAEKARHDGKAATAALPILDRHMEAARSALEAAEREFREKIAAEALARVEVARSTFDAAIESMGTALAAEAGALRFAIGIDPQNRNVDRHKESLDIRLRALRDRRLVGRDLELPKFLNAPLKNANRFNEMVWLGDAEAAVLREEVAALLVDVPSPEMASATA